VSFRDPPVAVGELILVRPGSWLRPWMTVTIPVNFEAPDRHVRDWFPPLTAVRGETRA